MLVTSDASLAAHLATAAGELLLQVRAANAELSASDLRERGDRVAQEFLAGELTAARPRDAVLSEEAADDPARVTAARVWIIDPLDGTREYAEGRDDWAVHVALWEHRVLTVGAVALPVRGLTLRSDDPPELPRRDPRAPVRIAVSRSRAPQFVVDIATTIKAELAPMGSAGYKAGAVLLGEVDAYVHAGGQYEWDSAAPVAVARAAGLHASRVDGSPLEYNQADPYLPDLVICRPELADPILTAIAGSRTDLATATRSRS